MSTNADEAKQMAVVGVDVLAGHIGLTTKWPVSFDGFAPARP